jgi:hypothetical protein
VKFVIGIQPDSYGERDASSPIWTQILKEAGHEVREIDVARADVLDQLRDCHGFMWRHGHLPEMRQIARRLLPVLERELCLAVYPDQATCWHYDDKIAQSYLFQATGLPAPRTWVWFERSLASGWAATASYPLVLKLWGGAGSRNVRLVRDAREAERWIDRLFGPGVHDLEEGSLSTWQREGLAARAAAGAVLRGEPPSEAIQRRRFWELHKDYVLFQEFLPGNDFDTRVTVIGHRAFAYRRFNRPGDFRASGSGNFDPDPKQIDPAMVELAFRVRDALGAQSVAIDGLRRGSEPVVCEVSYTYVSWMVHACPGRFERTGAGVAWKDGAMGPEEAQVADFLVRLRSLHERA